jgi:hypothetical protein
MLKKGDTYYIIFNWNIMWKYAPGRRFPGIGCAGKRRERYSVWQLSNVKCAAVI